MKNEGAMTKLVDRYLYDVTRRLPEKQRKDIEKELRTLIEDMMEEREQEGENPETIPEKVLEELGDPAKLAAKYRGEGECLIGGEYYALYCQVLKIVLIGVGIGMGVSFLLGVCFSFSAASLNEWIHLIINSSIDLGAIPATLLEVFGIVTIVFWLLERNQVKLKEQGAWNIGKLPQIPYEKAVIKRGDSMAGVIFGVLFIAFFVCASDKLGVWVKDAGGQTAVVPIFNMAFWHRTLPLMVISFSMGVIVDLVKLIVGHYNFLVMWVNIACNAVSMAIAVILLKGNLLFNPDLMTSISAIKGEDFFGNYDIMRYWNTEVFCGVPNICLVIILIILLAEVLVTVYRTLRYGLGGRK